MRKYLFMFLFLLPFINGFSRVRENEPCSCGVMNNVHKTGASSGSITWAWDAVSGATTYKLWYIRESDHSMSSYVFTGNLNYTFSGLPAGQYLFYFETNCGGEESSITGIEDIVF